MDSLWMDGDAYSYMESCKESGDQRDHEERKSEKLRPPSLALESIPSRPNGELTVETKFDVIKYLASSLEPIWGSTFEKTKALGLASEVVPDVEIKLDGHTHKKHKQINKEDVPDLPITSPHASSPSWKSPVSPNVPEALSTAWIFLTIGSQVMSLGGISHMFHSPVWLAVSSHW